MDKVATQQLAAELERDAEWQRAGLINRFAEHRKRALAEHVAEWQENLVSKGCTGKHAGQSANRVRRVLDGCTFVFWPNVSASHVQAFLAGLRTGEGLSIQTTNYYLKACKSFFQWMVQDGRASDNPLQHLVCGNAKTDRRHERRAFTDEELRHLITTTHDGPMRQGVSGPERALIYRLSAETGIRANETRTLIVGAFDLEADPPTITVAAAYSKRRRDDVLFLRPTLAADLRAFLANKLPAAIALKVPDKTSKMIRADLSAAGIEYRDDVGRVLDFHSLRHTFITNLAQGGVHPKDAQALARHSTITLTMDRYTHTRREGLVAALEVLPDCRPGSPEQSPQRATGTLGEASCGASASDPSRPEKLRPEDAKMLGAQLGVLLGGTAYGEGRLESASVASVAPQARASTSQKPLKTKGIDAPSHAVSARDGEGRSNAPGGSRTPNRRIRSPMLYPIELQARRLIRRRLDTIAAGGRECKLPRRGHQLSNP